MSLQQSQEYVGLIPGARNDPWTIVLFASVSLVCHLVFFLTIALFPDLHPKKRFTPHHISVTMVSMPAQGQTAAPAAQPAPEPKPEEASELPPPPAEPVEEAVAIPPEPEVSIPKKVAAPVKKRKFKPKKSLKHETKVKVPPKKAAPKKVEKKPAATVKKKPKPPPVDSKTAALDRLRKTVGSANPRGGPGGQGGQGGSGGYRALQLMDIYRAEIPYVIQKNWAFSSQLAGLSGSLYTMVVVKIARDGRILDIWFDERSGNRFLDESAYKAVQKSDPLPPLPPGFPKNSYTLGLRFTPQGIQ